jgi:hypothetical protein
VVEGSLIRRSDQWRFLERGYPAILVIEDYNGGDFNPFYHTVSDTIDVVSPSYFAELSRAAVATIADLGQTLPSGILSGTVAIPGPDSQAVITITAEDPTYRRPFTATTATDTSYNLKLPTGSYTVTFRADEPRYAPVVTRALILTDTVTILEVRLRGATALYLPWIMRTAEPALLRLSPAPCGPWRSKGAR